MEREIGDVAQTKIRLREELRTRLESAAKTNKRPMNREIVERLERSFDFEGGAGGSTNEPVARQFLSIVHHAEARTGKSWREDRRTWIAVASKLNQLLFRLAPPVEADVVRRFEEEIADSERIVTLIERSGQALRAEVSESLAGKMGGSRTFAGTAKTAESRDDYVDMHRRAVDRLNKLVGEFAQYISGVNSRRTMSAEAESTDLPRNRDEFLNNAISINIIHGLDRDTVSMFERLLTLIRYVETSKGKAWTVDPEVFTAVKSGSALLLEYYRPDGEIKHGDYPDGYDIEDAAERFGESVVKELFTGRDTISIVSRLDADEDDLDAILGS